MTIPVTINVFDFKVINQKKGKLFFTSYHATRVQLFLHHWGLRVSCQGEVMMLPILFCYIETTGTT